MQIDNNKKVYSVSRLNNYIKTLFDSTSSLKFIHIVGEIYDLKKSGPHHYFMLKDECSSIRGVLFYSDCVKLDKRIKDGDEVMIVGSVSVYPQKGQYQIYAETIALSGAGSLLVELERLKRKLYDEGLFDENKKREINIYPRAVGIISAKSSAAVQDMVVNLRRRYPITDIYVFDSLVQGEDAAKDIIRAIKLSEQFDLDTLIVGRGGGASEDLSAFNDEALIRIIAQRKIPLISAVGHEIDTTLIDLVSDRRASTPTGAVEIASIDTREVLENLSEQRRHLNSSLVRKLELYKLIVEKLKTRPELLNPLFSFDERVKQIQIQRELLNNSMKAKLSLHEHRLSDMYQKTTNYILVKYQMALKSLEVAKSNLLGLDPISILSRGYSITTTASGRIIKSLDEVSENEEIQTIISDGTFTSTITKKKKEGKAK